MTLIYYFTVQDKLMIFAWSVFAPSIFLSRCFSCWYRHFLNRCFCLKKNIKKKKIYICLLRLSFFFSHSAIIFADFLLYSINEVIKMKYILLELKVPWPMNTISETYNRVHNILELVDILPNVSFKTSETVLIKMVNTSWLMGCQTNVRLKKIWKLSLF